MAWWPARWTSSQARLPASFVPGRAGRQRRCCWELLADGARPPSRRAPAGEKVAIKKITNVFDHVSDATRILREIKLLRLLRHPGQPPGAAPCSSKDRDSNRPAC